MSGYYHVMSRTLNLIIRICLITLLISLCSFAHTAAAEESAGAKKETSLAFNPQVSGYIEGWYRADDSDLSNQASAKKVDNEFRVRRARIDVKGNVDERIGYRVTGSFDGPAPASGTASVKLWDGYIVYKINPLINITYGQFKYPFTLEGLEGTPDRMPVLRAESVNEIAGKLGTQGGSFRDIGAKIDGQIKDFAGLSYSLALINGAGINKGDNNNRKDIVGRVTISPVKRLSLGLSAYTGRGEDASDPAKVKESAYATDVEYKIDSGLSLRGEYITAKWENWGYDTVSKKWKTKSGVNQEPVGWYLQAAYKIPPMPDIELLAIYEDYDEDNNTANSHLKTTTAGITYYLKGKNRITVNYLIRNADSSPIVIAQETDATGSMIGNLFIVQAIVVF